jgi:hypothetical protein
MPEPRAGNAIDDLIAFAESLGGASGTPGDDEVRRQALSKEWQEARKLAAELIGVSENEAIRTYLFWSPHELQSATGQWIVHQGWPVFMPNDSRHYYRCTRLETIKNRILEYLHDELKRGVQRIEGYTDRNCGRWATAPVGSITLEALKEALKPDSTNIRLINKGELWYPRLIPGPAVTLRELQPEPDVVKETATPAPRDLKRLVVEEEILNEWEPRWAKIPPEPLSTKDTVSRVLPRVHKRGYNDAAPNYIRKIAGATKYKDLRRKAGRYVTVPETELIEANKRLIVKFRAELADKFKGTWLAK